MKVSFPTILAICLGLAVALTAGLYAWFTYYTDDFGMSWHGWLAFLIGATLTMSMSAGLFFLSYKSQRDGFDDSNHRD